ncbi:putative ribonucleotide reductase [Diplogelasinospora grovesii]|uniref:Ribonucleotide reductase n=1 Tax=Diplogelasinospora grovesii TaxID=303347 RepID=A0AAN6MWZ7_9PEZI|nr:putative ribonucleotide reductase [Diplogelasinospora grovesii]
MPDTRIKRQFAGAACDPAQRQITAFFEKAPSDSDVQATSLVPAALNGPVLPGEVRSNLISVGMRVRKSVPEGYKTTSQYRRLSLFSEDDGSTSHPRVNLTSGPALPRASASNNSIRELAPFCGIHKVGGLGVQSEPRSPSSPTSFNTAAFTLPTIMEDDDMNSMPSLTSSQGSSTSLFSTAYTATPTNDRKRVFIADVDEEDIEFATAYQGPTCRSDNPWLEFEAASRALTANGWQQTRILAVPKSRRGADKPGAAVDVGVPLAQIGQENVEMTEDDDFEEATFFDYQSEGFDMEAE